MSQRTLNGQYIAQMLVLMHIQTGLLQIQFQLHLKGFFTKLCVYFYSTAVCSVDSLNLGQFGVYNLTISDDDCSFHTFSPPINANLRKNQRTCIEVLRLIVIFYFQHFYGFF